MANTKHIRILESVAGSNYAYGRGYEGYVPTEIADDLLKAGHAELISAAKPYDLTEKATSKQAAKAEKR